ncbi:MAG: glycosyltransferase [Oscillospiraceae bacterium]|jgi:glycosyltransferase involved in cell wall biosynthesis|nr:glycosyltransferase [Oscillospiraceae bacterium]
MSILVTIVLPVYNMEKYLDRALNSVVNQTYKNLEIILVDDGSTDASPQMCEQWAEKDARIKVVHKQNNGLGMARNTGIENATGDYICFFDTDDYVETKLVEECVKRLEEQPADVVLFSSYNVRKNDNITPVKITAEQRCYTGDEIRSKLLPSLFVYGLGYSINVWSKMYNLQVIKQKNIYFKSEREIYQEDAYFNLEFFSKAKSAIAIAQNLYYYIENGNSLSRKYKEDRFDKSNYWLVKSLEYAKKENLPNDVLVFIQARYLGTVVFALKQIVASGLPRRQRAKLLKQAYKNETLRSTLKKEVLVQKTKFLALFFWLVKYRIYCLANMLLWLKIRK